MKEKSFAISLSRDSICLNVLLYIPGVYYICIHFLYNLYTDFLYNLYTDLYTFLYIFILYTQLIST